MSATTTIIALGSTTMFLLIFLGLVMRRDDKVIKNLEADVAKAKAAVQPEIDARIAAENTATAVVHAVEPLLQKTAWSMGELGTYQVRGQEVERNATVDRVRRSLASFNLPDATKGGSYEDLALLNPYTKGGRIPNRPYAEGTE